MKKLMFAVAAIAAGIAVADVTSENVVGYAGGAARQGNKIMGAQFGAIGEGKAIDLTTIKVTGYEEATEGELKMQVLDNLGRGGKTYYFYDVPGELVGWLDGNDDPVAEGAVMIEPGEGMWTYAPNADFGVQTSGEVLSSGIMVTLRQGNKMVVNTTPVAVDLTKIEVDGYEEATEGEVKMQVLDNLGRGGKTYYFYDVPGELVGWLDGNDDPVVEGAVMIEPGEGMWTYAPSTAYSVTLPGVEL